MDGTRLSGITVGGRLIALEGVGGLASTTGFVAASVTEFETVDEGLAKRFKPDFAGGTGVETEAAFLSVFA